MKFALLMALVKEELEDKVRDVAAEAGAGGVTIVGGRGSAGENKKSFLGLAFEGRQSILIYVLEKKLSLKVLKAIKEAINEGDGDGVAFTFPIEHLSGLNLKDIERFEKQIKEEI